MCVLAGASVCNTCVCVCVHMGVRTRITYTQECTQTCTRTLTHVRTPHSRLGVDAGVRAEHKRG